MYFLYAGSPDAIFMSSDTGNEVMIPVFFSFVNRFVLTARQFRVKINARARCDRKMKDINEKTNAVRLLAQKKIDFKLHSYAGAGDEAVSGTEVAEILGQDPANVFKTLVTVGKTGEHYVFDIPVAKELDLKKAAKAVGEKSIDMIKSKELLGLTGYIHGGCSPVGMKKFFRTVFDISAQSCDKIFFSGGRIGLQIETTVSELQKVIRFGFYDLTK